MLWSRSRLTGEQSQLTENVPKGHFQRLLVWFRENVSNTTLTIVCTINVSIDCDWFQVPNPITRENILK